MGAPTGHRNCQVATKNIIFQQSSFIALEFEGTYETDWLVFSPNKPKNGAITAGIVRGGTGKDSATGNGVDDSEEVRQSAFPELLFSVLLGHCRVVSYLDFQDFILLFAANSSFSFPPLRPFYEHLR